MNTKQKTILIWLMVWVGLLVGVVYSPIGSPDLYTDVSYFKPYQGVDFSTMHTLDVKHNAVDGGNSSSFDNSQIPAVSSSASILSSHDASQSASYSNANATSGSGDNMTHSVSSQSPTSVGGAMTVAIAASGRARSNTNSSFSTLAMNNTGSVSTSFTGDRQFAGNDGGFTGTDPGDDPTGNPIPVGDNWYLFLFLAIPYVLWKALKK